MKGGHNKKSVRVEFVMSEAEAELVKERMAELGITNLSAYLRKMAVDGYIIHLDKVARLDHHPAPGWLHIFGVDHCRKYTLADTAPCGNLPECWHPHRLGRWPPASGHIVQVPLTWAAPPPTSRTPGTAYRMMPGTRHTGCGAVRISSRPHRTRNLSQNDYVSYPYSYG